MKQPLDHLRSRKKPVTKRYSIALDSDVADAYTEARDKFHELKARAERLPKDTRLLYEADQAETLMRERLEDLETESAWFLCRSIGVNAYEDLVNQHLPTEEQRKKARAEGHGELGWNPDTFPPALLEVCASYVADYDEDGNEVLEPLTSSFVKELFEDDRWNQAEVMGLVAAAIEVNSLRRVVDMGNGSGRRRRS